jgi:hypothetical protein
MKAVYVALIEEGFAVLSAVENEPMGQLHAVYGKRGPALHGAAALARDWAGDRAAWGALPSWLPTAFLDAGERLESVDLVGGAWTWAAP